MSIIDFFPAWYAWYVSETLYNTCQVFKTWLGLINLDRKILPMPGAILRRHGCGV